MERLFGRDGELRRVSQLLDGAVAGTGGALLVLGEAGIGKSTLLDAADDQARARGMRVLRARAVEAERELAFAGLTELLGRSGASLALVGSGAPLAVAVAVLRVLEAAAANTALAVIVDDVQWLDEVSLDAVSFAARRVGAERIAVLLAGRTEPDRMLLARGLDHVELHGLDETAARALLDGELAAGTAGAVLAEAQGNPLALIELQRTLSEGQRSGAAPLHEPMLPSAAIERGFRAELAALSPATLQALVVLAADERLTLEHAHALIDPAALDEAERAGVLTGRRSAARREAGPVTAGGERVRGAADGEGGPGGLRFRHPLLRSVVYHGAALADRVAAHRALAERADSVARRAWHLAAAATGPDERAAEALADAADAAWRGGALLEAADAYARAAELTPADAIERQGARALPAARLFAVAGQPQRALAVAEAALKTNPPQALALQHVRGSVVMRTGALDQGALILTEHAERAAAAEPARAAQMLLDANLRNRVVGDYPAMIAVARRTSELAADVDAPLAALGEMTEAIASVNLGEGAQADATIARHEALLLEPKATRFGLEVLSAPAHASIWLERFDRADRVLSTLIQRARERAGVTTVVYPLAVRAQLNLRRGRLRPALADGEEAVRLAFETRQFGLVAIATAMLAEVEAALGMEDACREHAAASIGISDAIGGDALGMWGRSALGQLELTLNRPEEAAPHLQACARLADRVGMVEPNTVQWAANLVEALVYTGRAEEARGVLPRLERGMGTAWARGGALRGRGLVEEDEGALEASIVVFDDGGAPFDAARSRLLLGERWRRGRRRRDSREPLTAALATFEAAGATPWAERARAELRAGGQASSAPREHAELTPHELRVALLVAEGRTNPEVATQLFVTRKTVEHHLSQVYRKLGLRSRTELARHMSLGTSPMP